jgi:hypothetical protein
MKSDDQKIGVKDLTMERPNPDVNIKVNKTYDKDGNIIGYDSVYSYSYRYKDGNTREFEADSVVNEFRSLFYNDFSSHLNNDLYSGLFLNDSAFFDNFLTDDFFLDHFRNEHQIFEHIILRMDSLKNDFLKQHYAIDPKHNNGKECHKQNL